MILIIAPYSPFSRSGNANLGAARKLESIISILYKLDNNLVLVNSAHNDINKAAISTKRATIANIELFEITPPTYQNRPFGKLRNLFDIKEVMTEINKLGNPQFAWLYNGYAFEMLFAIKAKILFNLPIIFEFEDWHFSRSRGLNPKPYIDYCLWRFAVRSMSGAFVVNKQLEGKMRDLGINVELLPGTVPQVLADIASNSPPFKADADQINIGFFSGLNSEKGADIVLQLAHNLPEGYVLHVTGSGVLEKDFESAAKTLNGKLRYYGRVDDKTLYNLISKCDVLLNPHISIQHMNNGVFPFKVIEAVASGRLLISTNVPTDGLGDVLVGVQFVNHIADDFLTVILESRDYFISHSALIAEGAKAASRFFGEQALLNKIQTMIRSIPS